MRGRDGGGDAVAADYGPGRHADFGGENLRDDPGIERACPAAANQVEGGRGSVFLGILAFDFVRVSCPESREFDRWRVRICAPVG
jgi:hypothetical protein